MSRPQISTPQEVLALANVINPGGHRISPDNGFFPGRKFHETNCALVAIATAAFLQDGTEAAAFDAPSALMLQANTNLIRWVVNQDEKLDEEQDNWIDPKEFPDAIKKSMETNPGCSFVVHGVGDQGHHWFNVTPEGVAIDTQIGLVNSDVTRGQISSEGLRSFRQIKIIPVQKSFTGEQLLERAQDLHQSTAMISLSRFLLRNCGLMGIDNSQILTDAFKSLTERIKAKDKENPVEGPKYQNEETPALVNEICEAIAAEKGEDFLLAHLKELLTENPDREAGVTGQQWLTSATFRKPGSTETDQRVIDAYRNLCPAIDKAMNSIERGNTRAFS